MKVLITGSREYDNRDYLHEVLDEVCPSELVFGDCPTGADLFALEWAIENEVPYVRREADWRIYGRYAGPHRNIQMVDFDKPEICLAFFQEGASNRGTRNCSRYAKSKGVTVRYFGNHCNEYVRPVQRA